MGPTRSRSISMRQAGVIGLVAFVLITGTARASAADGGIISPQDSQSQGSGSIESVNLANDDNLVAYNSSTDVSGRIKSHAQGVPVVLERTDGLSWKKIAETVTRDGGWYNFKIRLKESTEIRVRAELVGYSASRRIGVRAGITLKKRTLNLFPGAKASIRGSLQPGSAGKEIVLQLRKKGKWQQLATQKTQTKGKFRFALPRSMTSTPGVRRLRVVYSGSTYYVGSKASVRAYIYGTAGASHYGEGWYGRSTACGDVLRPGTIGVAHKTLPCHKKVTFYLNGHKVVAPVIDRGPYVAGREFDLTYMLKKKLGFGDVGQVGYIVG